MSLTTTDNRSALQQENKVKSDSSTQASTHTPKFSSYNTSSSAATNHYSIHLPAELEGSYPTSFLTSSKTQNPDTQNDSKSKSTNEVCLRGGSGRQYSHRPSHSLTDPNDAIRMDSYVPRQSDSRPFNRHKQHRLREPRRVETSFFDHDDGHRSGGHRRKTKSEGLCCVIL